MQHAFTGEPAPWELHIARICEEWHRFPSELEDIPADELIRMFNVLGVYHKNYNPRAHESA